MRGYIGLGLVDGIVQSVPQRVPFGFDLDQFFPQLLHLDDLVVELSVGAIPVDGQLDPVELEFFGPDFLLSGMPPTFLSMISWILSLFFLSRSL